MARRRPSDPQIPLTPEQQDLAERYYPYARRRAVEYSAGREHLRDDYISACTMALCVAAQRFDPTRHVKFTSYLEYWFLAEFKVVHAALKPKGYRVTGCLRARREEIRAATPLRVSFDLEKGHDFRESPSPLEYLEWLYDRIGDDPQQWDVVIKLYFYDYNIAEIAAHWNCKLGVVIAIRDAAIERIRAAIEAEEAHAPEGRTRSRKRTRPIPPPISPNIHRPRSRASHDV